MLHYTPHNLVLFKINKLNTQVNNREPEFNRLLKNKSIKPVLL